MAQTEGLVEGLQVMALVDPEDSRDDDDDIAQHLLDAYKRYKQGKPKAAAAHAVDAVNMIATKFSLNCGASL